ncbi:MAG: hypothetical protein MUF14_00310, partial [Hyphomonadaceae bacterium]|nr:hypothetical protein [Hyphomonadaceae bacterium]
GPLPDNAAELLSSAATRTAIGALEDAFDLVVIDCPPLLGLADSPILSRLVETAIYVIAANVTNRTVISRSIQRLKAAGGHVSGVILTKFDPKRESYGGYDYESSYGDYAYNYGSTPSKADNQASNRTG